MGEIWQQVDATELAALTDDAARRAYFAERPELASAELSLRISEESGRALRVDLPRAAALSATARWLAEELDAAPARARALRAVANVKYFERSYEAAVATYEQAIAVFTEAGMELEAAITRSSALASLGNLSRYDEALKLADAARGVFERHEDLLHIARLENNLGMVLSRLDRFPEAIERYREARALFELVGQPGDVAINLRNIAVCYQDLNDFHTSLETYTRARDHCREHGLTLVGLEVEYNIAYLFYLRGEYGRAIRLFEQARKHSEAQDDRHHAALCDLDLAEIYLELNLVHDAEHLAQRSGAAFEALGMGYEAAKALAYQALAAQRQGLLEPALDLLARSRQTFRRQGNRAWVAMTEHYQALILFANGRLDEAAWHAEAAATGFRDAGVPSRRILCDVLRARLAAGLGDLETAKRRCDAALELSRETGRPLLEFQAQLASGQIAEASGDPRTALEAYRRSHEALERLRGQLQTDELKIAFADDKKAVYEGLVSVTLAQGRTAEDLETSFGYVETAKSRGLSDLLGAGSPAVGSAVAADNPLIEQLGELRQELNWYHRQISGQELEGGEAGRARLAQLHGEARRRERQLLRSLRRLRASDTELSSLQGSFRADLSSLRDALPANSALIEYFIARGVVYGFRLDHDGLDVQRVGLEAEVRKLHEQLRFQFGKFRVPGDYVERFGAMFLGHSMTLLEEMHELLLGDWRRDERLRHLIVVPHDFLHHLPFHALYDGSRFVVDDVSVSYAPSATVFKLCRDRLVECEERSLVLGVPDERAPKILDEVEAVAAILPNSRLLVGAEATRESLSSQGDGCRYVHLATHGLYRKDNPMFSALQLGDTRLSLLDLYDLRLRVELAVLSGCGTGLSKIQGTDELVGLTRGLLFAGARSVLATLWDVNDDSTAELMRHFYGRLIEESAPAAALRRAMIALRETYPHPYYWAPFVITGAP